MRAARLIKLLIHLQKKGKSTTRLLAELLEVSPRTVFRDIDALCEAGIPIISYRGNEGGFELLPNFETSLSGLTVEETAALAIGFDASKEVCQSLGLNDAWVSAKYKLSSNLSVSLQNVFETQHKVVNFRPKSIMSKTIEYLYFAITNRRIVTACYDGKPSKRYWPESLIFDGKYWKLKTKGESSSLDISKLSSLVVTSINSDNEILN